MLRWRFLVSDRRHASVTNSWRAAFHESKVEPSIHTYVSPFPLLLKSYPLVATRAGSTSASAGIGVGPHSGAKKRGKSTSAYDVIESGDGQCKRLSFGCWFEQTLASLSQKQG